MVEPAAVVIFWGSPLRLGDKILENLNADER